LKHFLGIAVTTRPLQKIDEESWCCHAGRFRLDVADPYDFRPDAVGKRAFLGLMMNADAVVKLKLPNLPLNWLLGALA
jgi:hypothetical protein